MNIQILETEEKKINPFAYSLTTLNFFFYDTVIFSNTLSNGIVSPTLFTNTFDLPNHRTKCT